MCQGGTSSETAEQKHPGCNSPTIKSPRFISGISVDINALPPHNNILHTLLQPIDCLAQVVKILNVLPLYLVQCSQSTVVHQLWAVQLFLHGSSWDFSLYKETKKLVSD